MLLRLVAQSDTATTDDAQQSTHAYRFEPDLDSDDDEREQFTWGIDHETDDDDQSDDSSSSDDDSRENSPPPDESIG